MLQVTKDGFGGTRILILLAPLGGYFTKPAQKPSVGTQ